MIVRKLLLSAIFCLAFLRTHDLLPINRPEQLPADFTLFLPKDMIAFFGIALFVFFVLLKCLGTIFGAKALLCAVRPKFLAAPFASALRKFVTVVSLPAFRLFPFPKGFASFF
jgi:hypothetical protein